MKLTERQVKIKKIFRQKLLYLWPACATMVMVSHHVDYEVGGTGLFAEMEAIPSIGKYWGMETCTVWLARHYPKTSNALFSGATHHQAMIVWSKEKRIPGKSSGFIGKESIKNQVAIDRSISRLMRERGDRNEKTNWGKCK